MKTFTARVTDLIHRHPLLSDGGYGVSRDYANKHTAWRASLVTPGSIAEIERLVEWIDGNLTPQRTINRRHSSYGLKHIAERETGYISNGQFIVAALLCGYRMESKPHYNPSFNITEASIQRTIRRLDASKEVEARR